jgi:hypothetical protein
VITSGLLSDRENCGSRGPCYFTVEMINTSASTIEVGKTCENGGRRTTRARRGRSSHGGKPRGLWTI